MNLLLKYTEISSPRDGILCGVGNPASQSFTLGIAVTCLDGATLEDASELVRNLFR